MLDQRADKLNKKHRCMNIQQTRKAGCEAIRWGCLACSIDLGGRSGRRSGNFLKRARLANPSRLPLSAALHRQGSALGTREPKAATRSRRRPEHLRGGLRAASYGEPPGYERDLFPRLLLAHQGCQERLAARTILRALRASAPDAGYTVAGPSTNKKLTRFGALAARSPSAKCVCDGRQTLLHVKCGDLWESHLEAFDIRKRLVCIKVLAIGRVMTVVPT